MGCSAGREVNAHEERARGLQAPAARGEISVVLHQQAAEVEVTTVSGAD